MSEGRKYLIVAWHDVARIVKDTLPILLLEGGGQNRLNVVDEDGRVILGKSLGSSEFTVGVKFATTLYNWRLQISPTTSEGLVAQLENQRLLELVTVVLSCIVLVAGVATILVAAAKERRISELKSDFVAKCEPRTQNAARPCEDVWGDAPVRASGEQCRNGPSTWTLS